MSLDDLLNDSAPDGDAVRRVTKRVVERLRGRRRRVRLAYAAAAAAAILTLATVGLLRDPAPTVPTAARVAEESSHPAPPREPDALGLEARVEAVLTEALELGGGARTVRRLAPRLDARAVPRLVEAVAEGGPRARLAGALLGALGLEEADEAAWQLISDSPRSQVSRAILEALPARRDAFVERLETRLVETEGVALQLFDGTASRFPPRRFTDRALGSASMRVRARALSHLAVRSPDRARRAFWECCEDLGGRALAQFLGEALSALSDPLRDALVAEAAQRFSRRSKRRRDLDEVPDDLDDFVRALGRTRSATAWPFLDAALEAWGPEAGVLDAVGDLGDSRAVRRLERWLHVPDARGDLAVDAIARIPGEAAVDTLLAAFETHADFASQDPASPTGPLRARIAAALRSRGDDALAAVRASCRRDRERQAALRSLCELFPRAATADLRQLLAESDRRTRPLVARAIIEFGRPEALRALVEALDDPEVRALARRALRRVARRDFGPRTSDWASWLEEYTGAFEERAGRFEPPRHEFQPETGGVTVALIIVE